MLTPYYKTSPPLLAEEPIRLRALRAVEAFPAYHRAERQPLFGELFCRRL